MLTENQFTAWPEDPAHLPKRGDRIRNSAECVRHEHGVDTVVLKRDLIAWQADELHLEGYRAHGPLRHPGHLWRWIEAPDLAHLRRIIEWEIQARSDTNLENPPTGARHHLLALAHVRLQPTREVDDSRKNVPAIQTHQFLVAFAARVGSQRSRSAARRRGAKKWYAASGPSAAAIVGRRPMHGRLCDKSRRRVRTRNDGATKCCLCMPTTGLVREQKRRCLS